MIDHPTGSHREGEKRQLAYTIDDLPYGRTYAYRLIRSGKLKAKKSGRRTIITDEAWKEHLAALPELQPKSGAA
jgi:hypothetical protein